MTGLQMAMFAPKSEWVPPLELPDLTQAKKIAIDVETKDPNLKTNGPGWPTGDGEVVGYAIATEDWAGYIPVRHFGGGNLDEKIVNRWLKTGLVTASTLWHMTTSTKQNQKRPLSKRQESLVSTPKQRCGRCPPCTSAPMQKLTQA